MAIEKGFAGPGLLAYIVTSKFADYLPLYRLEDIFERQGFEISRATQSVWCGDVADLVEPLYRRMTERVRRSHVVATDDTVFPMLGPGQTQAARMWVYVGDQENPYNVFDFTLNRGREGPKEFLKDYTEVLLADAYGGYNGVVAGNAITRAGCWSHARRKFVEAEKTAPEIAREAVDLIGRVFAVEKTGQGYVCSRKTGIAADAVGAGADGTATEVAALERTTATEASHGRSGELHARPMGGADGVHQGWRGAHR